MFAPAPPGSIIHRENNQKSVSHQRRKIKYHAVTSLIGGPGGTRYTTCSSRNYSVLCLFVVVVVVVVVVDFSFCGSKRKPVHIGSIIRTSSPFPDRLSHKTFSD